ncbi:MAG: RHS repeat-associated core domain-containing protein [Kiritimatiellales bacterium]
MKKRMKIAGLLLVFLLPIAVQAEAPRNPKLVCDAPVFDFGATTNTQITHTFVLKNEGLSPLIIERVSTGCGCVVAASRDKTIAPGDTGAVDLTITLRGRSGSQRLTTYVNSNDPDNPYFQLRCIGQVSAPTNSALGSQVVALTKGGAPNPPMNSDPHPRVSLKALDVSRAPTTEELVAAGQLGGALSPTHVMSDKSREAMVNLSFGKAMDAWNRHDYTNAAGMLRDHVKEFPDSPWVDEAALHVGCDASYNGRYSEAEELCRGILAKQGTNSTGGAAMIAHKARLRLALVKVRQNNLDEAESLFTELQGSADWQHRTYASHWIQRLSRYKASRQALLDCGPKALAYVLKKSGRQTDAKAIEGLSAESESGYSMQSMLDLGRKHGLDPTAIQIDGADLSKLKLPVIVQINGKAAGDKGHYWVLDKLQGNAIELLDPQSGTLFHQTVDEFCREWNGNTIVFAKDGKLPGRVLSAEELDDFSGGCCGVPRPPDNTGNPGDNGAGDDDKDPCGAPVWRVNVINMNLFVTDTPLWYDPPIGPPVRISLSYNSQSSITQHAPFGNKWQFNYASYLTVDTAGSVLIYMPDGRYDLFSPDGSGGYTQPYQVHNTLTKIAENHFELRFPDGSLYVYNIPAGTGSQQPFLVEIRDAYGQHLTMGYDANVNLSTITDAQGKLSTLTYATNGLCTRVTDPFGRSANFEYDAAGNLTKITDMGGYWSSLSYDANVYLVSLGDERGTTTFQIEPADGIYNGSNPYPQPGGAMWENYRITVTDPLGQSEVFHYNGYSRYSWHAAPRDYVPWTSPSENAYASSPKTRYNLTFTSSGTRGEISSVTYPAGGYVLYGYDTTTGNRTSVSDSHGHTTRFTFNSMDRVTSVTDVKGTPTTFTYATNGVDLLSVSNGLGKILMAYNTQHDLLSLTDRLTNITTFAYNTNGQILSQVDALGIINQYLYDATNRLAEFRRAGQTLEQFTYDAVGRVRTRTDAIGLTVTNAYNDLNQLVRVTYPDGRFESYEYATCCPRLLDSVTDRGGRTTVLIHDALKRLVQTINPEGGITRFDYDANGNRTALTDPNGNVTTFAYDLDDRLIRETYADGNGLSFGYDPAGLMTTRTNARGIVTTYTYDANHNLLTTSYSDGTPGVTNTYDAFNRLTGVQDGVGANAYTYDANSRLISYDGPWADDTITYAYDAIGRQTNLVVQGGTAPLGYAYDPLNRLTGISVGTDVYTYAYSNANPIIQRLDRPNGSYTTYAYDGLNRPTGLSNRKSTQEIINQFLYTYNAQDLRASETISNGLAYAYTTNDMVRCDYNNLNQLLTSAPPSQIFAYDADGNLTRGCTPSGYVFNATYDAENRLKTLIVTNGEAVVAQREYLYAWNSFLAQETLQGTNQIRHLRTGYLPLQERNSGNNVTRELAWGLNMGGGIGGLLNLKQSGANYSYVYDGKGNVTAVLNTSQAAVATYRYNEFGALLSTGGTLDQPFRFSTEPYDETTGFVRYPYRFYAPSIGRWLSRDPIDVSGGINLYAFVGNNPVNFADPLGLRKWHANWGGDGHTAGQEKLERDLTQADMAIPAKGQRDLGYKGHDIDICIDGHDPGDDQRLAWELLKVPPWRLEFWTTSEGYPVPTVVESIFWATGIPGVVFGSGNNQVPYQQWP